MTNASLDDASISTRENTDSKVKSRHRTAIVKETYDENAASFIAGRGAEDSKDGNSAHRSKGHLSNEEDGFVVRYRARNYDIQNFLQYHPGGRKILGALKNQNLDKAMEINPHSKSAFHLLEEFALDNQANVENHEAAVDWNAPILCQVGSLAENYWDWVNLPVNRSVRLFRSDLLERLSVTPWYLILLVWLPASIYFLHAGYNTLPSGHIGENLFKAFASYVAGYLLWTILEYVLHRKLFHFRPPANSRVLITLHFLLHGVHHKAPLDDRRLLFPPAVGILVAMLFWQIYKYIFPQSIVYFIAAGTTTGYLSYDLMHYYLHYGAPKIGTYLYTMKRNHNYHHFLHHDLGFGISTTLWDRVFQTKITLRQLLKPIEW